LILLSLNRSLLTAKAAFAELDVLANERNLLYLLGEHATFINGTDLLIDGGVIPAIRTGMFKLQG
jgi:hypothetical protein